MENPIPSPTKLIRAYFFPGEPISTVAAELKALTPDEKVELAQLIAADRPDLLVAAA